MKDSAYFLYTLGLVSKIKLIFVNVMTVPNDFEIETANKFMTNRYERDVFIPPFWELHSCYKNIKFIKNTELAESQTIHTL